MLSSAALQIIAIISMLIDHIGCYFFPHLTILRAIGRIAMPLFVFGIVEGFIHTRSRWKYFLRLAIFAVISQIPFQIATNISGLSFALNIIFGLLFAFMTLFCLEKKQYWYALLPLIFAVAEVARIEYGCIPALLAAGFYFCRTSLSKSRILQFVVLFTTLVFGNLMIVSTSRWSIQAFAILSIIPLALYSGKKGRRLPKVFSYAFYPVHLAIIAVILLFLH